MKTWNWRQACRPSSQAGRPARRRSAGIPARGFTEHPGSGSATGILKHAPGTSGFARRRLFALLLLALTVLLPLAASAHEDLLARIALLTERLRTDGPSLEVTFQRAEIYRLHQDWELALRDYDTAARGWTNLAELELGRGQALVGWGKLTEARSGFDRALRLAPTNAHALLERARLLGHLNEPALAVADYSQAIALQPNPRAADFLERASLQAAVSGPVAALKGLDEGLAQLGWTLTLQVLAVDYEVAAGNFDAALGRLETILSRSARGESWLARKAEILAQANRPAEARAAYESALAEIQRLPPRLAAADKVANLRQRIESSLTRLAQTSQLSLSAAKP